MIVVGVAMVKDEADIIGYVINHMQTQVDGLLIADNGSTDGTLQLLHHANDAIDIVIGDEEIGYYQSKKMTALAHQAHDQLGADWIIPFDADEVHQCRVGHFGDFLESLSDGIMVVESEVFDYMVTGFDDPELHNPLRRMQWRRETALPLSKVACRWREDLQIMQGNHGARYGGLVMPTVTRASLVRHFPYRSAEQMIKKIRNGAAAYAATVGLAPTIGAHWRKWGEMLERDGEEAIIELFNTWYFRADPEAPHIVDGITHDGPLVHDPLGLSSVLSAV